MFVLLMFVINVSKRRHTNGFGIISEESNYAFSELGSLIFDRMTVGESESFRENEVSCPYKDSCWLTLKSCS